MLTNYRLILGTTQTHTYTHTLSLSHTHSLSLSHTHTISLSLSLSHTHIHTYSLTHKLSFSLIRLAREYCLKSTNGLDNYLQHVCTHKHIHTHRHTHTHKRKHTATLIKTTDSVWHILWWHGVCVLCMCVYVCVCMCVVCVCVCVCTLDSMPSVGCWLTYRHTTKICIR